MALRTLIFGILGLAASSISLLAQNQTLVATNTFWSFKRSTNEASVPVTAWRLPGFDVTAWESSRAPFHYGENITTGTLLSNMRSNYAGVFLLRTFFVADKNRVGGLTLNVAIDDGFVAWINGVEVARANAPEGPLTFRSVATASASEPVGLAPFPLPNPTDYLRTGDNVLAVHAMNQSLTASSDFQFNASLVSTPPDTTPPTVTQVFPPPGRVPVLNQVSVTFSEAVQGVDATDFWVNGTPAKSVAGQGATYTFSFDPPAHDFAAITWFQGHGITDTSFQANPFDASALSAHWSYELLDDQPPRVIQVLPPANATLRTLSLIQVQFDEPVQGLAAADLLVNGVPALDMQARAASVYVFKCPPITSETVKVSWRIDHAIQDLREPANRFLGEGWSYFLNRDLPEAKLVINEFLALNTSAGGIRDEDRELEGWIELYNPGEQSVDLTGWSLTDDEGVPDQWIFPNILLGAKQHLVVFTSGKDRRTPVAGGRLHTNFKLGADGEFLGLYSADSPRRLASGISPRYPSQRNEFSYGRDTAGEWRYFSTPTPGSANGVSGILGAVEEPRFSVPRGFFNQPFTLSLSCETPGAAIRYTTNGAPPTESTGFVYLRPFAIRETTMVRAAAFAPNHLPSRTVTHTYLMGLSAARLSLPAISVVTASNHLRGPTGIMEVSPRNTTRRGIAWERPASAEYILPGDNGGFQIDCGLRVQGGDYIRGQYNPNTTAAPQGKFSFRLYFRGDYGPGKLRYPLFAGSPVEAFDRIVIRAGMNDPTNPFIVDELMRRLLIETGQVTTRGNHAHLFLNGVYKGYYNLTEGYEEDFFQSWHGGNAGWDLITQGRIANSGDTMAFNSLYNLITRSNMVLSANYALADRQMDMTNFVDYLLVNIYGGTGDWPNNNWRMARERSTKGKFRFYIWDAEWALGNLGRSVTANTLTVELNNGSEIATMFQRLRGNREFQLLFADRLHQHFFNGGALTDDRVRAQYQALRNELALVIPGMQTSIQTTWIPRRRTNIFNHLRSASLIASTNAPQLSQHGGLVSPGQTLTVNNLEGAIYYTLDGSDPRVPLTSQVAPGALRHSGSPFSIARDLVWKGRSLSGTNWSALTEAVFQVGRLGVPVRFTEIMHSPAGGDPYEFVELQNAGGVALNLGRFSLDGVSFTFPENVLVQPGQTIVIGSGVDPRSFALRYPGIAVTGWFGGSLSGGGERISLLDPSGRVVQSVDYGTAGLWPVSARTGGSLEVIDPEGDPDSAANWRASLQNGGTPGASPVPLPPSALSLSEVSAASDSGASDWVELHNAGPSVVHLAGWSLTDGSDPRRYVFPAGTTLAAGTWLRVWCDSDADRPGLHTGFSLDADGERVFLFDAQTNRVDGVEFGPQISGYTLSRVDSRWVLGVPTPNAANRVAELAPDTDLVINEWYANTRPGEEDWIELFNRHPSRPASLQGLYLSTSNALFRVTAPGFIASLGHVKLLADEASGGGHLHFKLPSAGGWIALSDRVGKEIARVDYRAQRQGFSEGRLPDGSTIIANFPAGGSGGAPNYAAPNVALRLHELLASPGLADLSPWGGGSDWIELHNTGASSMDLSGMSLSTRFPEAGEWRFPSGTQISPGAYLVVWMEPAREASKSSQPPLNSGMGLSTEGDAVFLFDALGRLIDRVEFGYQVEGLSLGLSSGSWKLLAKSTPGTANAAPASLGASSELKFNEWMAAPEEGASWFEIYNPGSQPVELSGHYLTDDPSIAGITRYAIGALSFVGPKGFTLWICDRDPSQGGNHVTFSLHNRGETLRLYSPGLALLDGVDFGVQSAGVSEGRWPDGSASWTRFVEGPTPAASNASPSLQRLRFDRVTLRGGRLVLGFVVQAGKRYQIETRTSLVSGRWEGSGQAISFAASGPQEVALDLGSATERYFRLVLLP